MKVEFYLTRLETRTKESNMYASQKVFKLFFRGETKVIRMLNRFISL